ncbi:MAG TPA: hypothetical protein VKV69_08745 [Actinomycetota bacterium]|nr:hypothetical protein [Actinomycetota bacterium]
MKWYWKTAIALGFVGVVAMGAAAFGQSGSTSPTPGASGSTQALGNPRPGRFGHIVHADATLNTRRGLVTAKIDGGTVTVVDANAHTLTIKRADGQSVSFTATDATRVRKDRQKATFGDITVGDLVQVIQIDRGNGFVVALIRDRSPGASPQTLAPADSAAGAL